MSHNLERASALEAHAAARPRARKGLSPRFADASSLAPPSLSSRLAHFWHPVQFASKLRHGESLTLFAERVTLLGPEPGESGWRCVAACGRQLPTALSDGMLCVWPGTQRPPEAPPAFGGSLSPPSGHTVHAELVIEDVPVEHGLLLENLLDLAHAPFTHTGTFAKGWAVPSALRFSPAAAAAFALPPARGWADMASWLAGAPRAARGSWAPYPIDMAFEPPCCVVSSVGLAQSGAAGGGASLSGGARPGECAKHLHQMHVCVPTVGGRTRLLYRMALDFAGWAARLPGMQLLWGEMAAQVLEEDLRLVRGQQARLAAGSRVWGHPRAYDKCAIAYRRFRNAASQAA